MRIKNCRLCRALLTKVISFGNIPIPNYFPLKHEFEAQKKYPLNFCYCNSCGLTQLGFIVSPIVLFKEYHYLTSASKPLIDHLKNLAETCVEEFNLTKNSKVLDIGCNDGTFLKTFRNKDIFSLGIEPVLNVAKIAEKEGILIIQDFFNEDLSAKILNNYGKFDLITATRVLANVLDLKSFIYGVKKILNSNGVFVAEVADLHNMLLRNQFDSIYHEHYSYFSKEPIQKLLNEAGLNIFKIQKTPFQGGELRIFATHADGITNKKIGVKITSRDYVRFAKNVLNYKKNIQDFFNEIKGAIVAGFGAPAKAVTLLNYCNLGKDVIKFIVDSTAYKQGRFLPGVHIPIYNEDYLRRKKIDFILLLAWNYKDQILEKIRKVDKDVKIIIPFPKLEVIK